MLQDLSEKVFIAIAFSLVPFICILLNFLPKIRYSYEKNTPYSLNNDNIEDIVIKVLTTWNDENIDNDDIYSDTLKINQSKHIAKNKSYQKKEQIDVIKVDGLRKFKKKDNGFTLIVSITLNYRRYNNRSSEGYNLLLPTSAQYIDSLVPPIKKYIFNNEKIVQKWWFIYEDGNLKVDKFK